MKKAIAYTLMLNLCIYIVVYLIRTFVIWEFTNPIQWIIDIPIYSNFDRGLGLFCISFCQIIQIGIVYSVCNHKRKLFQQ